MPTKLLFTSETYGDLDDAYDWYEEQRAGLGTEFLECVAACIDGILEAPKLYAIVEGEYRRAQVHRFPYLVLYEFDGCYVTVHGVFHTSRDSSAWRHRLP
jgi:hypothetical protein